eukprot:983090_1
MEAIFESVPEAVLQLVYVMRVGTSKIEADQIIFIVSIVQSIISMTNSILNNDYTMMKDDKWAKYKQRLPPSFEFFKHAICRISEIIYRIGLLALFWTVCGGMAISVLLGVEVFLITLQTLALIAGEDLQFDADTILLAISSIIVIPSEEVYGILTFQWHMALGSSVESDEHCGRAKIALMCTVVLCLNICCCMGAASILASMSRLCCHGGAEISWPPIMRIGISLYEIIFLVVWAFEAENGSRTKFLLNPEHGLVIFIVTCVCFVIFSQYRILFPDFALPRHLNVRSKWGYAYSNELTELQKIKVPLKRMPYQIRRKSREKDEDGNLKGTDVIFYIKSEASFWDEPYVLSDEGHPLTAAMFALVKENHEIVQWLESRGAFAHKEFSSGMLKQLIYDPVAAVHKPPYARAARHDTNKTWGSPTTTTITV